MDKNKILLRYRRELQDMGIDNPKNAKIVGALEKTLLILEGGDVLEKPVDPLELKKLSNSEVGRGFSHQVYGILESFAGKTPLNVDALQLYHHDDKVRNYGKKARELLGLYLKSQRIL